MAKQQDMNLSEEEAAQIAAMNSQATDQAELQALSGQVGNAEMQARVSEAGSVRDELLQFVMARLHMDRGVQLTEFGVLRDHSKWYREVSKGKEVAPDPHRWHKPAKYYKRATYALCAGETQRAMVLIEAAIQAEIQAFDGLTERVRQKLDNNQERPKERPAVARSVTHYPTCTPCKVPEQVSIADRITDLDPSVFKAEIKKGKRGGGEMWWNKADDEVDEESKSD